MTDFGFKEVDSGGLETLETIGAADKFNRWMYETIKPFCRGRILEIGSGIGNISQQFLNEAADITLSDLRTNYVEILSKKFSSRKSLREVIKMDLACKNFDAKHANLLGTFDCVFALNVVEHIEDDGLALANIHKMLQKNGKAVILVPAYQSLYNRFDKELQHYRRYSSFRLNSRMQENGFRVIHAQYFNLAGIPGWFVSGSLLKKSTIPAGQMKLYNALVPVFRLIDKVAFNQLGLSVISIGEKIK